MKKKRVLGILLSFALVLTMMPVMSLTAWAYDDPQDHKHEGEAFIEWDSNSMLPADQGCYYLTQDVTIVGTWQVNAKIALCLNGHSIKYSSTSPSNVITVNRGGVLWLFNCKASGVITGGSMGVEIVNGGVFNMLGGTITGNNNGVNDGGGVYNAGTFIMSGGKISGNKAQNGGGVYNNNYCRFSMFGGEISGNTASDCGGGVYNAYNGTENTEFNMSGGRISGNTAGISGGGVENCGTINFARVPKITGNTAKNTANNVFLRQGTLINIRTPLYPGAFVGVKMFEKTGTFTSGYKTYNEGTAPNAYFGSDDTSYVVVKDSNGEAQLAEERTVTFDSAGGSEVASQTVAKGEKATKPADPTRSGYTFDGWYKGDTAFDFNTPINENITIKARWKEKTPGPKPEPKPDPNPTVDDNTGFMLVTANNVTVRSRVLAKKARTKSAISVLGNRGIVTYELVSAKKAKKSCMKRFRVNPLTGQVKVKKGTRKGKYKLKVAVTDWGNYGNPGSVQIAEFRIRVK